MSAESLLVFFVGMLAGGGLGYVTAWRFARRLEHHNVELWKWDQHFDLQAPRPAKVFDLTGSQR